MEISSIKYKNGNLRLTIESIDNSKTDYRFAWRGNKRSKDGFINSPAFFNWEQLGQLIRKGFVSGKIKDTDINDFLYKLLDLKIKK